ncbi:DUF3536 domain-containing protein [soil metagenome]
MPERYLCLHGHFYQPPRENPWLEAVEVQDSAAPYHDWNERITMECYGPNTAARMTNREGKILDIRNNYAKISFNFGPTLLHWMEIHRPTAYEDIIEADRASVHQRGGHGNAIAQCYNHAIMPLGSDRDRLLQVAWGLEDFRERFGRDAEGMWLPECAVDLKSLDCLAANGVLFTVLAPRQARKFRLLGGNADWTGCDGGAIDPTRPYLCTLPSGRSITLFFYDGPISQAVAFEGLLNDGAHFAGRLMQGYSTDREWPQFLSIATDGESYGHHHRRGEMALAYALHVIEREGLARLTNFGEHLSLFTPEAEVQIWNNSSWSCVHGVERWRADCGCNSGMKPGWHQKWRGGLRDALRLLSAKADDVFDSLAPDFFEDPEDALLHYAKVLLHSRPESSEAFLRQHARTGLDPDAQVQALRLMEIMRNAQLMFTSCAWFFDDVSGLETIQNLKYAGRLIQLLRPYAPHIEAKFLGILERSPSNVPEFGDAAECYLSQVRPNIVDLQRVMAHHAITNFDKPREGFQRVFCHELHERDCVVRTLNGAHLKLCRLSARSLIDGEAIDSTVIVLHFGGHDFRCSITAPLAFSTYEQLRQDILTTFQQRSLTELVRAIDEYFGRSYYSLEHVFSEGRRDLLQRVTIEAFQRFDNSIRMIFEENRKFMDYLIEERAPLPQGFLSAADFVLKTQFVDELAIFLATGDAGALAETSRQANRYGVFMTDSHVARRLEIAMERIFQELALTPTSTICRVALSLLDVLEILELDLDNWEAQNIVFALLSGRPLPAHLEHRAHREFDPFMAAIPELADLAEKLHIGENSAPRSPALPMLDGSSPMSRGGSSERIEMLKTV